MRHFVIATLRSRWVAFVGVLLAMSTSVALTSACGLLLESGIRGGVAPERLASTGIVVTRDHTLSEVHGTGEDRETIETGLTERRRLEMGAVERIADVAGVLAASAEISFPATVLDALGQPVSTGPDTEPVGHSWQSAAATSFVLTSGHAPTGPGDVVLDEHVAAAAGATVGDQIQLFAGDERLHATVTGIVHHDGTAIGRQDTMFFTDEEATALFGHPGQVDLVAVTVAPGTEADVAAALRVAFADDDIEVLTGRDRGRAEFLDGAMASSVLVAISASLGGIAAAVAVMVVSGMLALIVQQRHREIALLRAIAATPRQVRRMIMLETMSVSVIGAAVGVVPGRYFSGLADRVWKDKGVLPRTYTSPHSVVPWIGAVVLSLVVGWAAASITGRRAARVRPIDALRVSAIEPVRFGPARAMTGAVSLAGTAAVFLVAMRLDGPIAAALVPALVILAMLVVAIFGPLLTAAGVRVLGLLPRACGASGHLAAVNVTAHSRRTAAAVTPVVLTIAVAGMSIFQQSTLDSESHRQGHDRVLADHVVAAGSVPLPRDLLDDIAVVPGVQSAIGLQSTVVHAGSDLDGYPAQSALGLDVAGVLDLDVRHGSLTTLRTGEVALSVDLADDLDADVGRSVRIRLGDGTPIDPLVVAVYDRSQGFADVVLPWDDTAAHVTDPALDLVLVRTAPGVDLDTVTLDELAHRYPGVSTGGSELIRSAEDENAATNAWVGYLLLVLVTAFAAIAVVNTLAMATGDRLREFALLRLAGTTRRQVLRMVVWESGVTVALAALVGAGVTLATLTPYSHAVTGSLRPSTPALWCGAIVVGTFALALVGSWVPARIAMRSRPVDSVGTKQ